MGSIPNDGKHLLRTKTSQKSLLKIFCYNNKVTRKVKNFQIFSNKAIYFTLQSNSAKYNNPFKLISWPNFIEEQHIVSPGIQGKTFTNWFKKYADGQLYIFYLDKLIQFSLPLKPAIHRMGNTLNILCPRCKEQKESQPYFIFNCKLTKITLDFISELINLKYAFNIFFKVTLKTIIIGTSSQFHDGVQLKILPTLSSEILLLNWAQKKSL